MEEQLSWRPPQISLATTPTLFASGKPHESQDYPSNFFRCAKWCPDGTHALAQSEDRSLQTLRFTPAQSDESTDSTLIADPVFRQPASILEFAWYPGASASNPALYCFVASIRESPVKLFDATNGRLRASYKIVDHRERQVAPHSMAFNCTTTQLYCGYEDAIEVFDFERPGGGTKIPTTPSKKSRDGMKGIVSSIAFAPDYSGLYAASSLTSAITLYSEESGADPVAYLDGMAPGAAITQVKFDPVRPYILYAAQRRTGEILCWDVREPLSVLRRFGKAPSKTNQKLLFDIDPAGRWLATGDEDGFVSIFDLWNDAEENNATPAMKYKAHDDAVGSVAFCPVDSSLLTVSGSRHFMPQRPLSPSSQMQKSGSRLGTETDSETDSSSDSSLPDSFKDTVVRRRRHPLRPFVKDASARVWKFSAEATEREDEDLQKQRPIAQ